MTSSQIFFDLFAIVGIALEIWGFYWLLKFNRIPQASELVVWAHKHGYGENWSSEIPRERKMIIDNDIDLEIITIDKSGGQVWIIPNEFYNYWQRHRNWSIRLVIIGLCGQILQILSTDIMTYLSETQQ